MATETLSMMKKVVIKKFGAKQFRDLLFVTRVFVVEEKDEDTVSEGNCTPGSYQSGRKDFGWLV